MVADLPPVVQCRVCGCTRLHVVNTRRFRRGTVRYRVCPDCGAKFRTVEVVECGLSAARNRVAARLDKAADLAVSFLRYSDENGVASADLYDRVRRRVPDVTEAGFSFRIGSDPRIVVGEDGRVRVRSDEF